MTPSKIDNKLESILQKASGERERGILLLSEEINKQRLVFFLGAGCSNSVGLPTWNKLINDLMQEFDIKSNEKDLLRLATRIEREVGPLKFRERIAEKLRASLDIDSALYNTLTSYDANLFITTNYDQVLENTFRNHGISPHVITQGKDIVSISPEQKTIIKLHGDIDSPTSLVITSRDYTRYKKEHVPFIDWLNERVTLNTVLFIGTSFDDPRLKEVDDHVINIFGSVRRQPFIFLKIPTYKKTISHDDFEIELEDYEALCDDFKERGFFVISIEKYDEIVSILEAAKTEALNKKIKESPGDLKSDLALKQDYSERLEKNLRELLDEKTLQLSEAVNGDGCLPNIAIRVERANTLINHLDNPPTQLSNESQIEGWLTATDALVSSNNKEHIVRGRGYFDKANHAYQNISDQTKWKERVLRVRAKLLFFEGRVEEAVGSLSDSIDNKTISIRLALLIDTGRLDEAYEFIKGKKVETLWVSEALYILLCKGEIEEAEFVFDEQMSQFKNIKTRELKESPFKSNHFTDKICSAMASGLLSRAILLAGKNTGDVVHFFEITEDGKKLCNKTLSYIDKFFELTTVSDPSKFLLASVARRTEMNAAELLGKVKQSYNALKEIFKVKPLDENIIGYILRRGDRLDKNFLENVVSRIVDDYPGKFISYYSISIIEGAFLKNKEQSWDAFMVAINLAITADDKMKLVSTSIDIGLMSDHLEEAVSLVRDTVTGNEMHIRLLNAEYLDMKGNHQDAELEYLDIETLNPPNNILSILKYRLAIQEINKEKPDFNKARTLLEESNSLQFNIGAVRYLLQVCTTLQDDKETLRLAELLESYDDEDWKSIHIKAKASRNLGLLTKSQQAWSLLYSQFPNNPEYAHGLAHMKLQRNEYESAFEIISPFSKNDDRLNFQCLQLAIQILLSRDNEDDKEKAFKLLNNCYNRFKNDYVILDAYMGLAYQTGHDDEAHNSLVRIMKLQKEGKAPDNAIREFSLDDLKALITERHEEKEKLNHLYRMGQTPRIFLCERKNMPLYLDWAVRTQEINLPSELKDWSDYTTYSTNSFGVLPGHDGVSVATLINPPKDNREIVIDYHALITIHRLGLLNNNKLGKRYKTIYYPHNLILILEYEQSKFSHPQKSRETVFRQLNKRLDDGELKEVLAPIVDDEYTPNKADLAVSERDEIPLIDDYIEKDVVDQFPDSKVIRLFQLAEWIFELGRIEEGKFKDICSFSKRENEQTFLNDSYKSLLDGRYKILVSETTIEIMEQHGLVDSLLKIGIQIFVERFTADYIKRSVRELDFGEDVAIWHKDLKKSLKTINFLKEAEKSTDQKVNSSESLYLENAINTLKFAIDRDIFLLTDDRWSQLCEISGSKYTRFGTDALIRELYDSEIIDMEEYSSAFLQLCKWRYRFLLPDVNVLVFLAKRYKANPPGEPLQTISNYFRRCMEDPGLFLGPERTDPPLPLGVKYYFELLERWVDFLVKVWADDSFDNNHQDKFALWCFQNAFPDIPKGIAQEVRVNLSRTLEQSIPFRLFLASVSAKKPYELHGLLNHAFAYLGYNAEKRVETLNCFLSVIVEKKDFKLVKSMAYRIIEAFSGNEDFQIPGQTINILKGLGLTEKDVKNLVKVPDDEIEQVLQDLSTKALSRKNLPEFVPEGPLVVRNAPDKRKITLLSTHDLIHAPSLEIRKSTIDFLLDSEFVSKFTKELIKEKTETISSVSQFIWTPAAAEVSRGLMKDFRYSCSLFSQVLALGQRDMAEESWKASINPDIDTILDELPISIQNFTDPIKIDRVAKKELVGLASSEVKKSSDLINKSLDWYLNNFYFVPFADKLSPFTFLNQNSTDFKQFVEERRSELIKIIIKWTESKEDPLATLMGIDIVLSVRGMTEKNDTKFLNSSTSEGIHKFIKKSLDILLLTESNVEEKTCELSRPIWRMRRLLAKYFLQYIDLNLTQELDESKKVAIAWWMSRSLCASILSPVNDYIDQDKAAWIEEKTRLLILPQVKHISVAHLPVDVTTHVMADRYHTIHGQALLVTATFAMLMPEKNNTAHGGMVFKGINSPTKIFPASIKEIILQTLFMHILFGEARLAFADTGSLNSLWDTPLSISVPNVFRAYYDKSFSLLGDESVKIIKLADEVTCLEFLEKGLSELPQHIENSHGEDIAITLSSLRVHVMTQTKMPENMTVFSNDKEIANKFAMLDTPLKTYCLTSLALIFKQLYLVGNQHWSGIFSEIFTNFNFDNCPDDCIVELIPQLSDIVLLGHNISILMPLLLKIPKENNVRSAFGEMKASLQYGVYQVPTEYKEGIKELLSYLMDVPISNVEQEGNE